MKYEEIYNEITSFIKTYVKRVGGYPNRIILSKEEYKIVSEKHIEMVGKLPKTIMGIPLEIS